MITESEYRTLLVNSLETAEEVLGSDFPVSSLILLLKLPSKGEAPMSQMVKMSRLSPAGVSRTAATLAGYSRAGRRVMDKALLDLRDDPMDRRYRMVGLTEAGKQFINRCLSPVFTLKGEHHATVH